MSSSIHLLPLNLPENMFNSDHRKSCDAIETDIKSLNLMTSQHENTFHITMVSCQKGPTRHAYTWQIGPFWQDTLDYWPFVILKHPQHHNIRVWKYLLHGWLFVTGMYLSLHLQRVSNKEIYVFFAVSLNKLLDKQLSCWSELPWQCHVTSL